MKGGMLYFGGATIVVLLVVGIAMYVSGGFQMLQDQYGPLGVAGFSAVFVLVSVGFMVMVRRSLKRALEQAGPVGEAEDADGEKV